MNIVRVALAMAGALILSACGSSSMVVLTPISSPVQASNITLVYEESSVGVSPEVVARTKDYLEEELFGGKTPAFTQGGGGITIKWTYIGYKPGSRAGRYFLGPLVNSNAKMVLRARFYDAAGNMIGEIHSEGEIGGGFFGGSANSAIKRATREVGAYAKARINR